MNEYLLVILFIIGITCFFLYLDFSNRQKLKKRIQKEWGQLPKITAKDSEDSLLAAYSFNEDPYDCYIDDLTWSDLDMFEVFQRLNFTYSSIGSESLYKSLRSYSLNSEKSKKMEELITYFETHPKEREAISFQFACLGKRDSNYSQAYLNGKTTVPFANHGLFLFLGLLPILSLLAAFLVGPIAIILAISSLCFNTIFYLSKKGKLEVELGTMSYLVQAISLSVKISKTDSPFSTRLKKASAPFKSILKHAVTFRVKNGGEAELMFEMLSASFLLQFVSYGTVSKKIQAHTTEAKEMWQLLGDIEIAIAILNLRKVYEGHWCLPTFSTDGVHGKDVIHPLLSEPVPNPIDWTRSTLITGSNASGKSTYVRAVAINCLFAQTINTCLAQSLTLKPGHVISSMGVQDNVIEGDSYFIAELKSLKRLIKLVESGEFCYCFVDEILKGTNTIERIAASSSVIAWLTKQNQLTFVATHDVELPQILTNDCDNIHFEETVSKENGISFDYEVKPGVATSRNAINLIDAMDFPKEIINESFEKAHYFEENHSWNNNY
ncbi:MAG: DNA mismatch repair protein MutS [Vagococcus sp.]|uniref:MutS-related protein n=1 Tax=Vagococcus sp. TaxID=1933889 RepID=UPI002FC6EDE9